MFSRHQENLRSVCLQPTARTPYRISPQMPARLVGDVQILGRTHAEMYLCMRRAAKNVKSNSYSSLGICVCVPVLAFRISFPCRILLNTELWMPQKVVRPGPSPLFSWKRRI